jgi:hypothetical protein
MSVSHPIASEIATTKILGLGKISQRCRLSAKSRPTWSVRLMTIRARKRHVHRSSRTFLSTWSVPTFQKSNIGAQTAMIAQRGNLPEQRLRLQAPSTRISMKASSFAGTEDGGL